ncbi:zf-TFIIB domain-containing protein [Acidisoma sp. S159]|uniref:TFIIB-type zinc ribbon-containing protein n=1 Tax=Acidisoma sp. S159 TaxID=1747225 RepID=UPI00131E6577
MSDRQGIEIDYCPKCRGVWLDRGELDKIIERNAQYAATPQQEPMTPASPAQSPWIPASASSSGFAPAPAWGQGYDPGYQGGHGSGHGGGGHGGGHGSGHQDRGHNSFLGRIFR